jgi:NADPH-dependent 2,4-dienoyl-CoA reductase/sulfur reductase-like enzyme/nitrite reductase/ring-hydroxylating ferredoxin subunit
MAQTGDTPLPDLTAGISETALQPGAMVAGRVGKSEVLVARVGEEIFAVGARCTHYRGPLAEGLIVGDTVRCPWHHACFSLRTGAPRAPALDPIACWKVERQDGTIVVREKLPAAAATPRKAAGDPASVVIVGGGAAGVAAAETLRREGYDGPVTIFNADDAPPSDRPNLSKDYLAGKAQDDWIPLRSPDDYAKAHIELLLGTRVASIDVSRREAVLGNGGRRPFGALLIATGADPVHPPIPGAEGADVHYLRTFADSRALIEKATAGRHAVVVGASFIGLEVAASLRARRVAVDVVAPEQRPLERVMGPEVGRFVQSLHEANGVVFHLGQPVMRIDGRTVTLGDGTTLEGDFVVLGVGVRPATALAEQAGLTMDRGIAVNEYLETSVPGIFAAGDVARWPDPRAGRPIRVEHWVVAQRQGETAARNMLGRRERFTAVPFFWSRHYDTSIHYVGHAEQWDRIEIDGSLDARDCAVAYMKEGRRLALATIGRARAALAAEAEMEREVS